MSADTTQRTTSFGFREVPESDKASLVRGVFDRSAKNYDLMNDVMSGGMHRLWKSALMDWLNPRPGQRLIDVAGGTGDLAFLFLKRAQERAKRGHAEGAPPAAAVVADINFEMLRYGTYRAARLAKAQEPVPMGWVTGDAEALPFPDKSFDAYTIAFGIRNVTRRERALREALRVLKPGGRFLCLEFSQVQVPVLDRLYDLHSFQVIPRLGELIARDRDSYQYLVESIRRFPDQARFAAEVEDAGFANVSVRNLTGGVAAMHSGWRV